MDKKTWEALKSATQGHTPRLLGACDPEGLACVVFCAGWTDADVALAAAAPDLLAEVERLRGWLEYLIAAEAVITRQYTTVESTAPLLANSARVLLARALNGAEVPK